MKYINVKKCPCCLNLVKLHELVKIPFQGKLKWYEFTPGPKLACPICKAKLKNTISNSKWLFLPFIALLIIIVSMLFRLNIHLWLQFILVVLSSLGFLMAMKNAILLPENETRY